MNKYLQILKITFEQEFVYKLSFMMWRFRNVVQILVFFSLWASVFKNSTGEVLGYTQDKIFTYAFALILVRAIVLSSRSVDVSGMIAKGDLNNLLLKPVNFFKYWMVRDISSKFLNISFGFFEGVLLILFLQPNIFIQTNLIYLLLFFGSLLIASVLYFNLLMIVNFAPFWLPEISWGAQFLFSVVFVEFLSGSFFPLDVFPKYIFDLLNLTPFPYLIFMPIKFYLGSFTLIDSFKYLVIGIVWCFVSFKAMNVLWKKGLLVYEGVGK